MGSPYLAIFVGTVIFVLITVLVVCWYIETPSSFVVALLIAVGLFLGLWTAFAIMGPDFMKGFMEGAGFDWGSFLGVLLAVFLGVLVAMSLSYFIIANALPPLPATA